MPCPLLPPGFRFHPTDEELITHYLKKKFSSPLSPLLSIIANIDLYKFNPWELPGTSLGKALFGEDEWFFFTPRDRKYPNGVRPNRTAGSGYWKATGADKPILNSSGMQCIGVKKALVFYQGYPRKGMKTDWIMHEYRLLDDNHTHPRIKGSMRLDEWVLCRVRQKSNNPKQIGTCSEDTSLNGIHQPIFPYSNDAQIYKHEQGEEEDEDLKMEHSLRNYLNFEEEEYQPSKLISKSTTDRRSNCINSPCNEEEMVAFKRTISFVSFGQAFPLSPSERLHSDAVPADNMEDSSIFQICYLSNCV